MQFCRPPTLCTPGKSCLNSPTILVYRLNPRQSLRFPYSAGEPVFSGFRHAHDTSLGRFCTSRDFFFFLVTAIDLVGGSETRTEDAEGHLLPGIPTTSIASKSHPVASETPETVQGILAANTKMTRTNPEHKCSVCQAYAAATGEESGLGLTRRTDARCTRTVCGSRRQRYIG